MRGTLIICTDPESVYREAGRRFLRAVKQAVKGPDSVFCVALAGGSTPRAFYKLLASKDFRSEIPWGRMHFFWGDERLVPHDHPQSNYRMAQQSLLKHVPVPPQNVHPVPTQTSPPAAAHAYEEELRTHFGARSLPAFDLILLGMGPDGHTASLFPGADALREAQRWVAAHRTGGKQPDRVTLTFPVLNAAQRVYFLVTGKNKATALRLAVEGGNQLPAQQVAPRNGELVWLVDVAAASQLAPLRRDVARRRKAKAAVPPTAEPSVVSKSEP